MKKTVESKPIQFSVSTLCRLMDTCLPAQIDDERDMQALINKLWPALVCEQECETAADQDFLEEHTPSVNGYYWARFGDNEPEIVKVFGDKAIDYFGIVQSTEIYKFGANPRPIKQPEIGQKNED